MTAESWLLTEVRYTDAGTPDYSWLLTEVRYRDAGTADDR